MEVIIRPDHDAASMLCADLVVQQLKDNPASVLGLATGRTMEGVYARLVEKYQAGEVDFSKVTTFNLDEYIGLTPDSPYSYHRYMGERLFDHVNIDPKNIHIPRGDASDVDQECRNYEQAIQDAGGIDLQLLGIGTVGHIGFNEPMSALLSRTRAKALTPETVEQNAQYFDDQSEMPRRAITMGVGTILESRRAILLATGSAKASILAKAVEGPVTSMISASALQLHPRCTVIVDEDAAADLQNREYYRWLFENEPEWAPFRSPKA